MYYLVLALTHCNAGTQFFHTQLLLTLSAKCIPLYNTANLRDLIAATVIVIFFKLDSNRGFFSPCDIDIWWVTSKNNRAPLLYSIKLCASFHIHHWIQTGVAVWKWSIRVKIGDFFCPVWPRNLMMALKNNRELLLCFFGLCASFHSHGWIQTGVTARKRPMWVKIGDLFVLYDLEIWYVTLKNNREPLLWCVKLCSSLHSHQCIKTRITAQKPPNRVTTGHFLSRVTLNLMDDLEK